MRIKSFNEKRNGYIHLKLFSMRDINQLDEIFFQQYKD